MEIFLGAIDVEVHAAHCRVANVTTVNVVARAPSHRSNILFARVLPVRCQIVLFLLGLGCFVVIVIALAVLVVSAVVAFVVGFVGIVYVRVISAVLLLWRSLLLVLFLLLLLLLIVNVVVGVAVALVGVVVGGDVVGVLLVWCLLRCIAFAVAQKLEY